MSCRPRKQRNLGRLLLLTPFNVINLENCVDCCNFAEQSGNERTTKSTVPITARYADTTMATTKKYLNHKQYGTLIQKCKDKISEFMLNTNYTSLAYEKCDYDPDREFWRLTVPTMGDNCSASTATRTTLPSTVGEWRLSPCR